MKSPFESIEKTNQKLSTEVINDIIGRVRY